MMTLFTAEPDGGVTVAPFNVSVPFDVVLLLPIIVGVARVLFRNMAPTAWLLVPLLVLPFMLIPTWPVDVGFTLNWLTELVAGTAGDQLPDESQAPPVVEVCQTQVCASRQLFKRIRAAILSIIFFIRIVLRLQSDIWRLLLLYCYYGVKLDQLISTHFKNFTNGRKTSRTAGIEQIGQ